MARTTGTQITTITEVSKEVTRTTLVGTLTSPGNVVIDTPNDALVIYAINSTGCNFELFETGSQNELVDGQTVTIYNTGSQTAQIVHFNGNGSYPVSSNEVATCVWNSVADMWMVTIQTVNYLTDQA